MGLSVFRNFGLLTALIASLYTVFARWEEATLEAEWRTFHPKPYHHPNPWPELAVLTHEMHKRICDDVVYQSMDTEETMDDNYTYINATDIRKERVGNFSVEFLHGIGDTMQLTLVICRYKEKEFYLTQGGENTVFRLVRDPERGIIFKSGQHNVLYDPYRWGEKENTTEEMHLPGILKM